MVMASPLLETKLFIPTRRRGLVARPRLSERLNRGTEAKLTLISAPAGFGKTTLLADWLEADPANGRSTAWLSLEQVTAQDVAALESRTEGWIAALQLAALSMQGREDVAGFIAGFAGDDRYIVDYLAEEVLQRQPEHVRHFLLQTSILDRLSGALCDAVTGQDGGRTTLEALERENQFLVPLDNRRRWYRYHHLFADVLQAHLLDEQPDRAPELHRRASVWLSRTVSRQRQSVMRLPPRISSGQRT